MHIFPGYPSYPPIANPVSMKHKFERDRSFELPEGALATTMTTTARSVSNREHPPVSYRACLGVSTAASTSTRARSLTR